MQKEKSRLPQTLTFRVVADGINSNQRSLSPQVCRPSAVPCDTNFTKLCIANGDIGLFCPPDTSMLVDTQCDREKEPFSVWGTFIILGAVLSGLEIVVAIHFWYRSKSMLPLIPLGISVCGLGFALIGVGLIVGFVGGNFLAGGIVFIILGVFALVIAILIGCEKIKVNGNNKNHKANTCT